MTTQKTALISTVFLCLTMFVFYFLGISFFAQDPDELIKTTIVTRESSGLEKTVVFHIPRKLFSTHVRRDGESVVLKVGYPDKAAVTHQMTTGDEQPYVSLYIGSGGVTLGDRYKAAIESGTLESKFRKTVLTKSEGRITLRETSASAPEMHDRTQLIYDYARQQWVRNRLAHSIQSQGEGLIKKESIYVQYTYRASLEESPLIMHKWAMSFVESLIDNNPNTIQNQ